MAGWVAHVLPFSEQVCRPSNQNGGSEMKKLATLMALGIMGAASMTATNGVCDHVDTRPKGNAVTKRRAKNKAALASRRQQRGKK